MQQSEGGEQTVTLMDVLNSIKLDTFEGCAGTIDGITYDIAKTAANVWLSIPMQGTWQEMVHNNIKRMESLMIRDGFDAADVNVSVPYAGVGYSLVVKISKYKAPEKPAIEYADTDNQPTLSSTRKRRG